MSLSDFLTNVQSNSLDDDQGSWRQFILDHLDYIARRSTTYSINEQVMNLFRYDLKRFLRENRSRRADIAWIVLLLNNMANDFEFVEAKDYLIPSDELIKGLYHSYITIVKNST